MRALSVVSVASLLFAAALGACDRGPSAVADAGPEAQVQPVVQDTPGQRASPSRTRTVARAPVPLVNGNPMWAANRRHTAQENATFQFARNGRDFGDRTEADYVSRAHAFAANPPATAQTVTRANGDRLIYDPPSNVFAVVDSDGAPRTLFKPRDGAAYWADQQARASRRQASADEGDAA